MVVGVALAVLPLTALPASAAAATFQVATARVNITPSALGFPNYYRAGYGSDGPAVVTGGQTLYATGLLLVNAAGQKFVIVSTDILAYPTATTNRLQTRLQTQFGIAPERVMLNGSHSHGGPVIGDQPNLYITYNIVRGSAEENLVNQYTTAFENRIVSLVQTLVETAPVTVSAKMSYGVAVGTINRAAARQSAVDPSVPVLTLRNTTNNRIVAVVFSYSTHAVAAGRTDTWNRDFAGVATDNIESNLSAANPGVRALYLRGPSGDQNPKGGFTTGTLGQLISSQVLAAVPGGAGSGATVVHEPEIAGATNLQAPLDIRVNDATLRQFYVQRLAETESMADHNHAQLMIEQIDNGTLRRAMTVRVTGWRFGAPAGSRPLALIGLAGEPTADFAAAFDTVLGTNYLPWTTTGTNGHPGYIPSDEIIERGDNCPGSGCFYGTYESGWAEVAGGQRYPSQSATTYNDGLIAPLRTGVDSSVCAAGATIITGGAGTDCTKFSPGRVIPHGTLSVTGPAYAAWTDGNGRQHLELLALGSNRCVLHRSWTGGGTGSLLGTWSAWDSAGICGGITGPPSAEAWVDAAGRAHIEMVVRTTDGSIFHGRCVGDTSGCANRTWNWTQLGTPSDGFIDAPEIAVWKQQNGFVRMDLFQVRGSGRCLNYRGFTGTDTDGNGSWSGWANQPGCGGIVGPAAATTWRASNGTTVNHDVMVRTTNGAMFTVRCSGTEASCTWGAWAGISAPGVGAADAPAFSAAVVGTGVRSDLYVRGNDGCIWQAGWTAATPPTSPSWRNLAGCGLASRVGAVTWQDSFGRSRSDVAAISNSNNGPMWVRGTSSATGNFADDVVRDWEDIADSTMWITP